MTDRDTRAIELHARGLLHRDRDEWLEALDAFEAVRAIEEQGPDEPRRWWNLGMTLHEIAWIKAKLGHLDEALGLYESARDAKQKAPPERREWNWFSSTLHELGYAQKKLGMNDAALESFTAALTANRSIDDVELRRQADAASLNSVAHLHLETGAWAPAVEALTAELVVLDERMDPARVARELYWLAYAQVELEEWEAAEVSVQASLRIFQAIPDSQQDHECYADALDELAHLKRRRGDRDGAAREFRAARTVRRHSLPSGAKSWICQGEKK
jgi:tetratricopeptide (TPR) repeat protein